MPKLKIASGEWVVVCDGSKALVLENVGDEKFPNLQTREVFEEKHAPTSQQGTDEPGRAFNAVGGIRSAVEQTDFHALDERRFLERLVAHLDEAIRGGRTRSLVIVAPPRALGVIRQAYTHPLRNALREEIDKDLVKLPVYEIERHLTG